MIIRHRLAALPALLSLLSGLSAHGAAASHRVHGAAAPRPAPVAPAPSAPAVQPASVARPAAAMRQVTIGFSDLGSGPIALQGAQTAATLNIGTRKDETVVAATLHLRLTYSPAMLPDLSHLRVSLNGQVLAAIALTKSDAGREIEREIQLDPRYFSDYNEIRFELIGHYTLDCEDPQHSSLWASISPQSDLTLTLLPIELRDDLALLPVPFFDQRDKRPLTLPIVLAANPSREVIRSAGVAASWFGALADYRGARFPVDLDSLPTQHALVFATNQSRPALPVLPEVDKPTVRIVDHPSNPLIKLLVFQGKDEAQLRQAVVGFILGNAVMSGESATVSDVTPGRRVAYDAPRWLRGDRAIKLGELISADRLQGFGIAPPPMNIDLRLPPDLFTWNHAGVPIELHYRYTAPAELDNSMLTVTVNDQLLRSYRLTPQSAGDGKLAVALLQSDDSRQNRDLFIPAFQLASDNRIQFRFAMERHRQGLCNLGYIDGARESIDPDSTIDISGFPHYTALPNLALFANAGFPFTRYADLAETGVVLPDAADRGALEQLFFVLGRMGRQTGTAALEYRLLDTDQALRAHDLDLLILGGERSNELVSRWGRDLSLAFDATARDFRPGRAAPSSGIDWARRDFDRDASGAAVHVHAAGSLGAFMSFESPVSSGRTVVALLGSDGRAVESLTAVLGDDGKTQLIRGDLTIVRGGDLQSYQGGETYYVGSLSWWQWLWFHLSHHALWVTLLSLGAAIAAALLTYGRLQRLAARRLGTRAAD
jgi:hypothetical protein